MESFLFSHGNKFRQVYRIEWDSIGEPTPSPDVGMEGRHKAAMAMSSRKILTLKSQEVTALGGGSGGSFDIDSNNSPDIG